MRILIHIALFAMLAGYLIPSIDGCCCNWFSSCTGDYGCNVFGCNCETYCYKGRCGYCYKCNLNIDLGKLNIGVAGEGSVSAKIGTKEKTFHFSRDIVPLNDENLECCGSGCRRRRRSLQDMILVSSSLTFGHSEKQIHTVFPRINSVETIPF